MRQLKSVYVCELQEQFHIGLDSPLENKKTREVAVRTNTHFVAFHKENINTGGNAALVSTCTLIYI